MLCWTVFWFSGYKGFEGLYEVDTEGNIYSIVLNSSRRKGICKPQDNGIGYKKVVLYSADGKPKKKYIHRLVAEAFVPNPQNKRTVNHKDSNRANNSATNLEWNTQSENIKHCVELGRHICNYNAKRQKGGVSK